MEHIIITIITLAIFFLPTFIALVRDHHNKVALIVTNLLLGWTGGRLASGAYLGVYESERNKHCYPQHEWSGKGMNQENKPRKPAGPKTRIKTGARSTSACSGADREGTKDRAWEYVSWC